MNLEKKMEKQSERNYINFNLLILGMEVYKLLILFSRILACFIFQLLKLHLIKGTCYQCGLSLL